MLRCHHAIQLSSMYPRIFNLGKNRWKFNLFLRCQSHLSQLRTNFYKRDRVHETFNYIHAFNSSLITNITHLHIKSSQRHLLISPNVSLARHVGRNMSTGVSESQRRRAQLELERMVQSTSRLLAIEDSDSISDALVNEASVLLNYWSRRWYMHFHPGFGRAARGSALSFRNSDFNRRKDDQYSSSVMINLNDNASVSSMRNVSGDFGAHQAERILDWSISHNLVSRGLFDHNGMFASPESDIYENHENSPNMACVNIIETYLLPCVFSGIGSFGYSNEDLTSLSNENQRNYATLSKHYSISSSCVQAIVNATRVMRKMRLLQSKFPEHLSPDTLSIKSELNVWSKRLTMIGKDQNIKTGGIVAGSIVEGHSTQVNPSALLKTLEQKDGDVFVEEFYSKTGCLSEMESVLSMAEDLYLSTKDESILPSVDWYNHILGSWARSDSDQAYNKSLQMLRGMEKFDGIERDHNGEVRECYASPDIISYNSVLFCIARNATKSRAREALALLQKITNRYQQTKNKAIQPDEVTYGIVLHTLAQVGMAHEAESILDVLEDEYSNFLDRTKCPDTNAVEEEEVIVPSLTIYNSVLNAWANCLEKNAPRRAEFLLERMKSLSSTGRNPSVEPDTVSLSTVISCYARSNTREGAERAEELLIQAISSYSKGNERVRPDLIMFNCAILGWAHCNVKNDEESAGNKIIPAERAEMLLQKMKDLRTDESLDIRPVAQTFNIILDSWAKSERKGAAEKALKLMREMSEYGITPDVCSYNSVLHAISKEEDRSWIIRAEEIFQEMKDLQDLGKLSISDVTYNAMMNVYGKSCDWDGARKAEALLRIMVEEGFSPTSISYNTCIDAYARAGHPESVRKGECFIEEMMELALQGKTECRPTIHSFSSVINALAKSTLPDATDRAMSIVRKVEDLDYVSPNTILYNSLIYCIVMNGGADSLEKAAQVLQMMEQRHESGDLHVYPDSYAYSMVLTLCARSKKPGAAYQASNILDSMERLHAQGHPELIANSRCYSAVITAWARSRSSEAVRRSLDLLDRMEKNRETGSPHGKPNAHCYNACIHAIAKSSHSEKSLLCSEILQRMIEAQKSGFQESAPTSITYSTILNGCAYTSGDMNIKKHTFNLARTCFQVLLNSENMELNEENFANFFLVISRHLGPSKVRDSFAEAVFKEACIRGKINARVLHCFRVASPLSAQRVSPDCFMNSIPEKWSRNIKDKNK